MVRQKPLSHIALADGRWTPVKNRCLCRREMYCFNGHLAYTLFRDILVGMP